MNHERYNKLNLKNLVAEYEKHYYKSKKIRILL